MDKNLKIAALITAAGEGKRFGFPKWKAKITDRVTFLERITYTLKDLNINEIYCTYRKKSKPNEKGIKYILNEQPNLSMFSSIYYGAKIVNFFDGILIWPVDHPNISKETVKLLLDSFTKDSTKAYKPSIMESGGHPIIIPKWICKEIVRLSTPDYKGGLRQFIRDRNYTITMLECDDINILKNINKLSDLDSYNFQKK